MKYNETMIRSRYQLVPRTLVFIRKDEKYLFIHKKKENSFGFKKLNGIGGHIEQGEEPYESAKREIQEETGLTVENLTLAAIVFIEIGINPGILMFVFSAFGFTGIPRNSDEGDLLWLSRDMIDKRKDLVKDIPYLVDIIETHPKNSPPQFIKYLYDKNKELRIVKD